MLSLLAVTAVALLFFFVRNSVSSSSSSSLGLFSRGDTVSVERSMSTPPLEGTTTSLNAQPSHTTTPNAPKIKTLLELNNCPKYGSAQGNQDCILDRIFQAIGTTNKFYVEYGFNTNQQCSNSGPNTCRLWKEHNWTGLLLDGSHTNPAINLHAHYLYSNNMVSLLDKYNVPAVPDFLSGDMDSHDYFVLKTILDSGKYRPRVITTEYNANYPLGWAISEIDPTIAHPYLEPPPYKFQNCTWGASPAAFRYLMEEKFGYKMVAVTRKLDLFWIRQDILDALGYDVPSYETLMEGMAPLENHPTKGNTLFLEKLVDVKVYEETKSVRLANRAIVQKILEHVSSPTEPTIKCLANVSLAHIEEYLLLHPPIGKHLGT